MKTSWQGLNRWACCCVLVICALSGCDGSGQDGSSQQASSSADNAALPSSSSSAGAVTLSWLPPTTNTNGTTLTDLAGYRIYYGQSPTAMTEVIDISNAGLTAYMVENLSAGTWYFAVKAVTTTGIESSLSNVASTTIS
jgi:hypothetical protein